MWDVMKQHLLVQASNKYHDDNTTTNKHNKQVTTLLEEHGGDLHAAGKTARLVDRMSELLSDGNLKVKRPPTHTSPDREK